MNIVIPAEAGLDTYKAAFVLFREKGLHLSNLVVAYPTKEFTVNPKDICIGMDIQRDGHTGKNYQNLDDLLTSTKKTSRYSFLNHIPDSLLMCFLEYDKTVLAMKLFKCFVAFDKNLNNMYGLPQKIKDRQEIIVGKYRIMCVSSPEAYLTPEDRIALFKTGFHYIAFCSNNSVGVQKCVQRRSPMLTEFVDKMRLNPEIWFTHCRGHLVISKNNHTPDLTVQELCAKLEEFLSQKESAVDSAP